MRLLKFPRGPMLSASLLSLLLLIAGASHGATAADSDQLEVILKVENMT